MSERERRIGWGVIGAGGIARRRTIPEGILAAGNCRLASVFDPARGDEVGRQFGVPAHESAEALLRDPAVDAVYVATPVHLHAEQCVAAAAAGKHVLCEKPLARDVAEAEQMVRAAEQHGVRLGVGLMMRFHALHQAAARMLRDGKLGKPVFARAQLSCWYPPIAGAWRQRQSASGGGALMDLGAHCLDLLELLLGPAERVCCTAGRAVHAYEVEDSALAMLEFASGARAVVDCFFNIPDDSSRNRLEIYGTEAALLAEGTIGQSPGGTMTLLPRGGSGAYDAQQSRRPDGSGGGGIPVVAEPINMYRAQVEAFADAVLSGRPPPVDGVAGLRNQRLLAACYESSAGGRWVSL